MYNPQPEKKWPRRAALALGVSALVAIAILIGGLLPRGFGPAILKSGAVMHCIAFFLLVLSPTFVWPKRVLTIILAALLFGAGLEVLQSFVGRSAGLDDFLADIVGAGLGGTAGVMLSRRL